MSWISFLPPSSAGCALPAMTSWIGRSGCSSRRLSRSGSRIISVSRLYDAARRAKPIVSTSGSRALSIQPSSARAAPRFSHERREPLAGVDRRAARAAPAWSPRSRLPGTLSTAAQNASTSSASGSAPWPAARSKTSRATQVGACTPLVIEPIGTSASSKAGHRPLNMPRLTWPCSCETPLARCASRKPITAMLKTDGVAALVVLGAEREDPLDRDAGGRAGLAEVLLDQRPREAVDAGRAPGCAW